MDNAGYVAITRQSGLLSEMQIIAHNLANLSTTGFRREGVIFAEHVRRLDGAEPPLAMAHATVRMTDFRQGELTATGGSLDFAIEGEGFFLLDTPQGERLSRAGRFLRSAEGELVTVEGYRLLDAAGAPVVLPPDAADLRLAPDGTLSADGQPVAGLGLFRPAGGAPRREAGGLFAAPEGVELVENGRILQGFLEESNVQALAEVARMIEVSRAYELGQAFLSREDERIRHVIRTLAR